MIACSEGRETNKENDIRLLTDDDKSFGLTDEEYERLKEEREQLIAEANKKYGYGGSDGNSDDGKEKRSPIVQTITEDILNRYRFITIEESKEILVYDNGV